MINRDATGGSAGDATVAPESLPYGRGSVESRERLQFRFDEHGAKRTLAFKRTAVLEDIRVLEMYESAIRHNLPLSRRAGNWVQEYFSHLDALRFIEAQFKEPSRIRQILEE